MENKLNEPPPATQEDYYFDSLSRAPHRIGCLIRESAENVAMMRKREQTAMFVAVMLGIAIGVVITLVLAVIVIAPK
jgi:hypothetical protein